MLLGSVCLDAQQGEAGGRVTCVGDAKSPSAGDSCSVPLAAATGDAGDALA